MTALTIIDALASRDLFAGMFDKPSWRPWITFLKVLFGLQLDDEDLAIYRRHTGRQTAPLKAFREAALIIGRRGGKSRILALIGVFLATAIDWAPFLAPGETPVVAIIAADRKQARVLLGYVTGLLRSVPALSDLVVDELAETVTLSNGVAIEITTNSIGAPRGRTYAAVLGDEVAFWVTDGAAANADRDVIAAVRPGLATLPGSLLLIASSPYAKRGVLFDHFTRYFGKDDAPVLVWRGATLEMNSALDPSVVKEAEQADPESAAAEYGAEFRTDITAFIGRDAVEAVVASGIIELPPAAGITYAGFVDPSGGSADSMTLAVSHMGADGVAVLDVVRERRPPFSPEEVTAEFCAVLASYGVTRVTGDAYAGEWPRERFAAHGIAYDTSARNKSTIYGDFLPALNGRRVRLLDLPRLIAQLCNLERRVSRGGRDSIDHGPGQHDDVANCVCGALTLVINDRRPALIRTADMLTNGAPVPMPAWATCVYATMIIGKDGQAAVAFFAHNRVTAADLAPLVLIDFDYGPLSGSAVAAMYQRLEELHRLIPQVAARIAWLPSNYVIHAHLQGYIAEAYPDDLLQDLPALAISAAGHVMGGRFKIAEPAMAKSETLPLTGALDFRAGEVIDANPMRLAVLAGIALGLTPQDANSTPVPAAGAAA